MAYSKSDRYEHSPHKRFKHCGFPVYCQAEEKSEEWTRREGNYGFFCHVCQIGFLSSEAFKRHTDGLMHIQKIMKLDISADNQMFKKPKESAADEMKAEIIKENDNNIMVSADKAEEREKSKEDYYGDNSNYCCLCKMSFESVMDYNRHIRGLMHTRKVMPPDSEPESSRYVEEHHFLLEKINYNMRKRKTEVSESEAPLQKDMKGRLTEDRDLKAASKTPLSTTSPDTDEHATCGNSGYHNHSRISRKRPRISCYGWDASHIDRGELGGKWIPPMKDLTPEDVSRDQLTSAYHCDLCDINCTGPAALRMHFEGNKHKLKMLRMSSGLIGAGVQKQVKTIVNIIDTDRPSRIMMKLNEMDGPFIGLQYITEFQKQDDMTLPRYVCNLCECRCDCHTIVQHAMGTRHRLKYIKYHYTEYTSDLWQVSERKADQTALAEQIAREIESTEGRQLVKTKIEIEGPVNSEELSNKEKMFEETGSSGSSYGDWQPYEREIIQQLASSSKKSEGNHQQAESFDAYNEADNLEDEKLWCPEGTSTHKETKKESEFSEIIAPIVQNLPRLVLTNEEEASLALQISQALTQALLAYRLRSVSQIEKGSDTGSFSQLVKLLPKLENSSSSSKAREKLSEAKKCTLENFSQKYRSWRGEEEAAPTETAPPPQSETSEWRDNSVAWEGYRAYMDKWYSSQFPYTGCSNFSYGAQARLASPDAYSGWGVGLQQKVGGPKSPDQNVVALWQASAISPPPPPASSCLK